MVADMNTYEKIVRSLATATFYVTMVGLSVIAGLTFLDVCLRYILNRPILGVYDITRVMLIVTVACAFGYTQMKRGNMAIDLLILKLGPRKKAIVSIVYDFIGLALFLVITWQAFRQGNALRITGDATETVLIPFYPFVYIIAFNMGVVCLIFVLQLAKSLGEAVKK
jgi:TRAP-type C4-dicarboxylate transport system permease small subunit